MEIAQHGNLSTRDLRNFGLTFAAAFGLVIGVIVPLLRHRPIAIWPWIIATVCIALALLWPRSLRPLHLVMTRVGHVLGAVQTRVFLTLVFFVVITPIGAALRLVRRRRGFQHELKTYRVPSQPRQPKTLERPF